MGNLSNHQETRVGFDFCQIQSNMWSCRRHMNVTSICTLLLGPRGCFNPKRPPFATTRCEPFLTFAQFSLAHFCFHAFRTVVYIFGRSIRIELSEREGVTRQQEQQQNFPFVVEEEFVPWKRAVKRANGAKAYWPEVKSCQENLGPLWGPQLSSSLQLFPLLLFPDSSHFGCLLPLYASSCSFARPPFFCVYFTQASIITLGVLFSSVRFNTLRFA